MKHLFLSICITAALTACIGNTKKAAALTAEEKTAALKDSTNYTTLEWIDSVSQNIGKVKKGQTVEVTYKFKNSGNKPLIISDVHPGCGCTVAEKPEKPVMPGESDKIVAKFDSQNQMPGSHSKSIGVTANTKPSGVQTLMFTVDIVQ